MFNCAQRNSSEGGAELGKSFDANGLVLKHCEKGGIYGMHHVCINVYMYT